MKDENMLKKKDFDDAAVVAALRRGHRQRLYFEQIYPPLAGCSISP